MQYILYIKSLLYQIHVYFSSIWHKESSLTSVIFCQVWTNLVPMDLASKYQLLLFLKKKCLVAYFLQIWCHYPIVLPSFIEI